MCAQGQVQGPESQVSDQGALGRNHLQARPGHNQGDPRRREGGLVQQPQRERERESAPEIEQPEEILDSSATVGSRRAFEDSLHFKGLTCFHVESATGVSLYACRVGRDFLHVTRY